VSLLPLTFADALLYLPQWSRRPHLHPPECCRYPLHLQVGFELTNSDHFFPGPGSGWTSPLHPVVQLTNLPSASMSAPVSSTIHCFSASFGLIRIPLLLLYYFFSIAEYLYIFFV
jgi:hypothetical protein